MNFDRNKIDLNLKENIFVFQTNDASKTNETSETNEASETSETNETSETT